MPSREHARMERKLVTKLNRAFGVTDPNMQELVQMGLDALDRRAAKALQRAKPRKTITPHRRRRQMKRLR